MQLCDLSVQSLGIEKKQLSSPCPKAFIEMLLCHMTISQKESLQPCSQITNAKDAG